MNTQPILPVYTIVDLYTPEVQEAITNGLHASIVNAPKDALVGIFVEITYNTRSEMAVHDVAQHFLISNGKGGITIERYLALPASLRPQAADLAQRITIMGEGCDALGRLITSTMSVAYDQDVEHFCGYLTHHGLIVGNEAMFDIQNFQPDAHTQAWPDLSRYLLAAQPSVLSAHRRLIALPQLAEVATTFFPLCDLQGETVRYHAEPTL